MDKVDNGYETMLERGEIILNNHKFVVQPIFLGEEQAYLEDVSYSLYPRSQENEEPTSKDLSRFAIMLFSSVLEKDENKHTKTSIFKTIKIWLAKKFTKDYRYYADNPSACRLAKWIEKKVYYKNKHIRFYDLERKFGLNKAEIVELFKFFQEMSGF